MNGVHDMGGMQDMGPIQREKAEPVFHAPWERRVFALMSVVDVNGPTWRFQIESIPPADYLRMSYYEKWLAALGPLLTNAGMATADEVESGRANGPGKGTWHVVSVAEVATWTAPASATDKKPSAPARFHNGQRVRARNMNPVGHTRLPRYARGKVGTVERDRGVDVFPDAAARGLGEKPQRFYSVRFTARELWGGQGSPHDAVYIDTWEDYLEPA